MASSERFLGVEIDRPVSADEVEIYFTDEWSADRFVEWWDEEGLAHFEAYLSRVAARGYNPKHNRTEILDDEA